MSANPCAAIVLDAGIPDGVNRPMLERAFSAGLTGDVPPPVRLALDDRDVGADMAALQERHPHVSRRQGCVVVRRRREDAARYSPALEIDGRFVKHPKTRVGRRLWSGTY